MPNNKKMQNLWTKNFILITIINLLLYSSWQMFPSALPPYVKSLGGSDSILGWINGIATVSTLIIRPFSGSIMDKFGRKGIFLFGLILMSISTAAYAFWPIVGIILAIRFIHGLAWGIASTASNTIAVDNIPKDTMAQGMAYFSLSVSLSSAISPALALSLKTQTMIWTGVAFVIVALLMSFGIDYSKSDFVKSDNTKKSPYEKSSALPAFLMFLVTTTYGAIVTFLALFAAEKGYENIGLFFTVYALAMLVSRPLLGNLIQKKGFSYGVIPGAILSAAAMVLLSKADSYGIFLLCGAIYGVGYASLHTSLQTMSVVGVPSNRLGAANATFFTGFDGGMGFGSIVAGILAAKIGYGPMYGFLSICLVLVLILFLIGNKIRN